MNLVFEDGDLEELVVELPRRREDEEEERALGSAEAGDSISAAATQQRADAPETVMGLRY
jgi:hypothetical protein